MNVREVMTTPVITAGPDTPFAELVDKLLTHDISGLPIVDGHGHLLGVVTEADLISKEAYGHRRRRSLELVADFLRGRDPAWVLKGAGRTAADLMTRGAVTASPGDDLVLAARQMLEDNHKRLPVVEDERLVGIVTRHDLLQPFHRGDDEILADIEAAFADPMRVPETHDARASVAAGVVTLEGTALWPGDVTLLEAVVGRVAGVVGIDNRLSAREPAPHLSPPPSQPLR